MATLDAALAESARLLAAAGIDGARLEARLLAGHVLGIDADAVIGRPGRRLAPGEAEKLAVVVRRRIEREPIAYILREREFWSLPFGVNDAVLIPRPDSETLVAAALDWTSDRGAPLRILDLGTGSGCLLLSVLSELPNAHGVGVDISAHALRVARDNAGRLGLRARAGFVQGDWAGALTGEFDMILANPPYLAETELHALAPEIARFEPPVALFAGDDGLACYRALIPDLTRLLAEAGAAFLEIGAGQAAPVASLARNAGLIQSMARKDLAGIDRCLVLRRP
ncbi:MAG: peptide chain release factor N(5)-glutamine methyltransferase [Rhodospirillaceae bacterium]|nr:peptide chain release factor N(5)-glutamine methyltransferase [Rhodospirillaceae bacterium]